MADATAVMERIHQLETPQFAAGLKCHFMQHLIKAFLLRMYWRHASRGKRSLGR